MDAVDVAATDNQPYTMSNLAPITAGTDYDRDGLITASDGAIADRSSGDSLPLLAAPAAPAALPPLGVPNLFNAGDQNIPGFYSPNLVTTNAGTVLAIAEIRSAPSIDTTAYGIAMRRSTDGGANWSPISMIYSIPPGGSNSIGVPSAVVDKTTGKVFVLFMLNDSDVMVSSSSDDGLTWTAPTDITSSVKVTASGNPNPAAYPDTPWGLYDVSSGHAIQLQNGPYAGRILVSANHGLEGDDVDSWSNVIYSDDHGQTWHLGGGLDQSNPQNSRTTENSMVELSDGSIYMSIRYYQSPAYKGFARSTDGGMTWTNVAADPNLPTGLVQDSTLRLDANTLLLSAPEGPDGTRHQMTIWVSHNNGTTWVKTKVIDFGEASYSDMTVVAPDTVLLAYVTGSGYNSIALARFNLAWLEGDDPYQFTWNFNEQAPGAAANLLGPSIRDESPWDNRGQAQAATPGDAPVYVQGSNPDDSALELASGSDRVQLTSARNTALDFHANDSFTVQIVMRSTDSDGVVIGSSPSEAGWTLQLVAGHLAFSLNDGATTSQVTSDATVNDGAWHRLVVVRDAATGQLSMYVDGVAAAAPVADTTTLDLIGTRPVTLGAYADGNGRLVFDVDTLRVTRAVVDPSQFLLASYTAGPRFPAAVYPANAPNTISGLQFWLPAYDPASFFSDMGYALPLALAPAQGTAAHTAIDASSNQYHVSTLASSRQALYTSDSLVGPSWQFSPYGQWIVQNSSGADAQNFDFVQDTGVFTLSTFIKLDSRGASTAEILFNTNDGSTNEAGFSFLVAPNGSVQLSITDSHARTRFLEDSPAGLVSVGSWYQLAVVGNGVGNPVTFYVTPVSASTVAAYDSASSIAVSDGDYPTVAGQDLVIGATHGDNYIFSGQMVDQVIYNRALTAAEIQQLFEYTKKP